MQLSLKAARDKKDWSLDDLAERSGVNKSTISRLERGETKPLYETVVALETALALKPGTLKFDAHEAVA